MCEVQNTFPWNWKGIRAVASNIIRYTIGGVKCNMDAVTKNYKR